MIIPFVKSGPEFKQGDIPLPESRKQNFTQFDLCAALNASVSI